MHSWLRAEGKQRKTLPSCSFLSSGFSLGLRAQTILDLVASSEAVRASRYGQCMAWRNAIDSSYIAAKSAIIDRDVIVSHLHARPPLARSSSLARSLVVYRYPSACVFASQCACPVVNHDLVDSSVCCRALSSTCFSHLHPMILAGAFSSLADEVHAINHANTQTEQTNYCKFGLNASSSAIS